MTIRSLRTEDDMRDLDELVIRAAPELNRTWVEAIDLSERLADGALTTTWLARDDHEVLVGFVALHHGQKNSDRHTASLRIYIAPGFRDQGLGRQLIERATNWADDVGIVRRITATPYMQGPAGVDTARSSACLVSRGKVSWRTRFVRATSWST